MAYAAKSLLRARASNRRTLPSRGTRAAARSFNELKVLIAGFMAIIGKISWWKSLLTAFIFVAIMFVTFDIAFDVIMPKGPLEAAFGY